jgi:hypothetical protein
MTNKGVTVFLMLSFGIGWGYELAAHLLLGLSLVS